MITSYASVLLKIKSKIKKGSKEYKCKFPKIHDCWCINSKQKNLTHFTFKSECVHDVCMQQ